VVSRLAFGTASLHHLFSATTRYRLIAEAFSLGITHFDTSPYYGYGIAEVSLGKALVKVGHACTIATKVGLYPPAGASASGLAVWVRKAAARARPALSKPLVDWSIASARRSLDMSLRRLARDYVDFLLLHEPAPALVGVDEVLRWLETEAAAGRIRAWGVAGAHDHFGEWIAHDNPLVQVVQSFDDREGRLRRYLATAARPLQFTYGYFAGRLPEERARATDVIADALVRNATGAVLISTRSVERLRQAVSAAGNG
jgi:aryl-alcohol dehydrogenase-like predicted oxidoreductase